MPLPPLPESNTARLWVQYDTGVGIHEMQFRKVSASAKADFITQVRSVCTQLAGLVWNSGGFTSARYASAGVDLSFPEPWAAINGTNVTAPNPINRTNFVTFSGRSPTGRKARLFFFNPYVANESDFRLELGDSAQLQAAWNVLMAATPHIAAIDGAAPTWYPYYNFGFNAYWQRKARTIA